MIDVVAVPQLAFAIAAIEPQRGAATPTLRVRVRIDVLGGGRLEGMTLAVRLRICAHQRRYAPAEAERLRELFGAPEDFGRSLRAVPWTEATVSVGPFEDTTVADVPVPCTYDFEVVSAKYFSALEEGDVPVEALFSGTLFYAGGDGRLQAARIPWHHEAAARMPLATWRAAVDATFPDSAWLRVDRALFAALQARRARAGHTTWDATLAELLEAAER